MALPNQSAPVMAEDAQAPDQKPAPGGGAPGDAGQTAELPVGVFGGETPKEGDTCTFKVVAVNAEAGVATVAYAGPEAGASGEEAGGADGMAAEFSKDKMSAKGGY